MTTREILEAARAEISTEDRWTQGAWTRTDGRKCAIGAVMAVTKGGSWNGAAWRALRDSVRQNPESYNDSHDHACVLQMFDAAIEKLSD